MFGSGVAGFQRCGCWHSGFLDFSALDFWVAQIGDGFGGNRRGSQQGHGEVVRCGDGGGF